MHPDPSGWPWGLCSGLPTHSCKIQGVTETPTRNLKGILALGEDWYPVGDRMKLGVESRICLETKKPMAITLPRTTMTIETWNVRMMLESWKVPQVIAEMGNYNLTVLGISYTRWTGCGQQRLAKEELLLYSSHEVDNAPHTHRVVLMVSKTAMKALTGWDTHRTRTVKAIFQIKKQRINIYVIRWYAPINDSNEDVTAEFYSRLSTVIQNCPRWNITTSKYQ